MCMVSNIGDGYRKTFPGSHPWTPPAFTETATSAGVFPPFGTPTRGEFNALRAEMQELRELLLAAKDFDAKTGHPDCEVDEKVAFLRSVAAFVGVDLSDVFPDG